MYVRIRNFAIAASLLVGAFAAGALADASVTRPYFGERNPQIVQGKPWYLIWLPDQYQPSLYADDIFRKTVKRHGWAAVFRRSKCITLAFNADLARELLARRFAEAGGASSAAADASTAADALAAAQTPAATLPENYATIEEISWQFYKKYHFPPMTIRGAQVDVITWSPFLATARVKYAGLSAPMEYTAWVRTTDLEETPLSDGEIPPCPE